jgi:cysteine-rich repeat protein
MRGLSNLAALAVTVSACQQPSELAPRVGSSSAAVGPSDIIFDEDTYASFRITMHDPGDWDDIIDDPFGAGDDWHPCDVQWSNGAVTETITNVGIKRVGTNRPTNNPKPAVRLKFNEFVPGQLWRDTETIKLEGHILESFVERVVFGLHRDFGVPAPRATHAQLTVDGDDKGVYGVVEPIRKRMLSYHLGIADPDGNLYERSRRVADGSLPTGDSYVWEGSNPASYVPIPFEPITNEVGGDYSDIVELIDVLDNAPAAEVRARLQEIIELDVYLSYLAVLNGVSDGDGILRSTPNNHYWYHREDTGKLQLIPWDASNGFGAYWILDGGAANESIWARFGASNAGAWIPDDPVASATFEAKIRAFADGPLSGAAARVTAIADQLRDAVYDDPYRLTQIDTADGSTEGLTTERYESTVAFWTAWIDDRVDSIRAQVPEAVAVTVLTAPEPGVIFTPGQEVTATGTGANLSWAIDRSPDGLGPYATGTGSSITFTVPDDATDEEVIKITLTGDGGELLQTHAICATDCDAPDCGDGDLQPGEMCDDGNLDAGDGCDGSCVAEPDDGDGGGGGGGGGGGADDDPADPDAPETTGGCHIAPGSRSSTPLLAALAALTLALALSALRGGDARGIGRSRAPRGGRRRSA